MACVTAYVSSMNDDEIKWSQAFEASAQRVNGANANLAVMMSAALVGMGFFWAEHKWVGVVLIMIPTLVSVVGLVPDGQSRPVSAMHGKNDAAACDLMRAYRKNSSITAFKRRLLLLAEMTCVFIITLYGLIEMLLLLVMKKGL